jgi:hypothetical protein
VSEDEAVEEARRLATLAGRGVVEPALTDAALAGEPAALADLDLVVQERVLSDDVVRVKVWTRDGDDRERHEAGDRVPRDRPPHRCTPAVHGRILTGRAPVRYTRRSWRRDGNRLRRASAVGPVQAGRR